MDLFIGIWKLCFQPTPKLRVARSSLLDLAAFVVYTDEKESEICNSKTSSNTEVVMWYAKYFSLIISASRKILVTLAAKEAYKILDFHSINRISPYDSTSGPVVWKCVKNKNLLEPL